MTEMLRLDMGPVSTLSVGSGKHLLLGTIVNAIEMGHKRLHPRPVSILNCTDDRGADWLNSKPDFVIKRLDHLDGIGYPPEKITEGIKFIEDNLQAGHTVLVCCHAGISRSPGMILAYLLSKKYDYNDAIRTIRKARHFIRIHSKIDLSIRKYFGLAPRTVADLIGG